MIHRKNLEFYFCNDLNQNNTDFSPELLLFFNVHKIVLAQNHVKYILFGLGQNNLRPTFVTYTKYGK